MNNGYFKVNNFMPISCENVEVIPRLTRPIGPIGPMVVVPIPLSSVDCLRGLVLQRQRGIVFRYFSKINGKTYLGLQKLK